MSDRESRFESFRDGLRFLAGAVHYHGGLAVIGLLLVLPLFGVLRGLGVPYLYWPDSGVSQFSVGATMGAVYWHLGIVAYGLAAAKPDSLRKATGDEVETKRYVQLTLVPLFFVILGLALAACAWTRTFSPARLPPHYAVPWVVGFFGSYLFTLGVLGVVNRAPQRVGSILVGLPDAVLELASRVSTWFGALVRRLGFELETTDNLAGLRTASVERKRVFGLLVFFSGLMMLAWLFLSLLSRTAAFAYVPAAVPFCLTLGLIASLYGLLRVLVRRLAIPVVLGAIAFVMWQAARFPSSTAMPSNCDSEGCETAWSEPRSFRASPAPLAEGRLVSDDAALAAQLELDPMAKSPIVIITTSGGGIRSAAWTTAIFNQLVELDPEFFTHVRLITGASGGMVGAAHWISAHAAARIDATPPLAGDDLYCKTATSSLYAPFGHLLLWTPGRDRGEALELAWERTLPSIARPLREFADLEATGTMPSLVFAPMIVEDGSQMLMTNLDLGWYALADHPQLGLDPRSCPGDSDVRREPGGCHNARQFFARVGVDTVKVSTLARINASFPYVSPAVTLPFDEHPRAVDAGYYDNYGTKLAVAWIARHTRCPPGPRKCLADGVPILLLELRDHDPDAWSDRGALRAMLHELSSPIEGLFAARLHVAVHRNSAGVAELQRTLDPALFEHVVLHFEGEASLSWELTEAERGIIWANAREELAAATKLRTWWAKHATVSPLESNPTKPSCISD